MLAFQAILAEISFSSADFIAEPKHNHTKQDKSTMNTQEFSGFEAKTNEKTSFLGFCETELKEFEELSLKEKNMRKSFFDPIEINVKEFDLFSKED